MDDQKELPRVFSTRLGVYEITITGDTMFMKRDRITSQICISDCVTSSELARRIHTILERSATIIGKEPEPIELLEDASDSLSFKDDQ